MAVAVARALTRGSSRKKSATRKASKRAKKKASRKASKLGKSVRKAPVRWKIPRGKRDLFESIFKDQFGPAPRGTSWSLLAERYPERFRDYLEAGLEAEE